MARKQNKEKLFVRIRRSIVERVRDEFEFMDVKIMTHVLTVVLMVSIIAATVAWFTMNVSAKVKGFFLSTATSKTIELSLDYGEDESGNSKWVDVLEDHYQSEVTHGVTQAGENNTTVNSEVSIAMPAFENIYDENGEAVIAKDSMILAPGTYGSFSFYVKSVNSQFTGFELSIVKVLESVIADDEDLTNQVNQLFNGHILCFASVSDADGEGDETPQYQYISMDSPVTIEFSDEFSNGESEVKEVTVYWVWPYEYKDLTAEPFYINKDIAVNGIAGQLFTMPVEDSATDVHEVPDSLPVHSELKDTLSVEAAEGNGAKLSINQVFCWERYNETVAKYRAADAASDQMTKNEILSDWYDYGDTLIGSYVEDMLFHIQVKGVKADGSN